MHATATPLLVACFGNPLAGDDAFGEWVGRRVEAMALPDVEVACVGMQPFGLVHRLTAGRQGLVIVDAAQATSATPAGALLDVDFHGQGELQLVHDTALSTHGLSIANELQLASTLHALPPRVRLIAATLEMFDIGCRPSAVMRRLVQPAALRVASIAQQWRCNSRSRCRA